MQTPSPSKFCVTEALGSSSRACQMCDIASRTCTHKKNGQFLSMHSLQPINVCVAAPDTRNKPHERPRHGAHLSIWIIEVSVKAGDDAHDVGPQLLARQLGNRGKAARQESRESGHLSEECGCIQIAASNDLLAAPAPAPAPVPAPVPSTHPKAAPRLLLTAAWWFASSMNLYTAVQNKRSSTGRVVQCKVRQFGGGSTTGPQQAFLLRRGGATHPLPPTNTQIRLPQLSRV